MKEGAFVKNYFAHCVDVEELYENMVSPVCEKYELTYMEFTVLMFLANNPQYDTATQIVRYRHLAKSHVSISIRSLQERGLILGEHKGGNHRTIHLSVAGKATDIIAAGRAAQKKFCEIVFAGFSKEEMEKMASNSKYYAEKMHSIQGALRMSEEINAQFGFERAFGKTTEIGNSIDSDMKITKFGISFNSDGSTSFFAQLEKTSENQKDYLEKIQEKKAAEKKEAKKKERSTQVNIKRATVEANSKEELLDKIKNIEWDSIKPEDNKIGSRFDFSI